MPCSTAAVVVAIADPALWGGSRPQAVEEKGCSCCCCLLLPLLLLLLLRGCCGCCCCSAARLLRLLLRLLRGCCGCCCGCCNDGACGWSLRVLRVPSEGFRERAGRQAGRQASRQAGQGLRRRTSGAGEPGGRGCLGRW